MKNALRTLLLITALLFGLTGQALAHTYTLSANEPTVEEGGTLTFTVSVQDAGNPSLGVREGDSVAVSYTVSGGTATSGVDFISVSGGTLTFNSTSPGPHSFTVDTIDDDLVEENETVQVEYTFATSNDGGFPDNTSCTADWGTSSTVFGAITDNDRYRVTSFTASPRPVVEGNDVTLTVTLNQPVLAGHTVNFTTGTAPGSAGSADYGSPSVSTLQFSAGDQTKTFTIPIIRDHLVENDETFQATLTPTSSNVDSGASTLSASVTISSPDVEYTITFDTPSLVEPTGGTAEMIFVPTITPTPLAADIDETINWTTSDGTAAAGSDYVANSGTLTLTAAGVSGTVSVTINPDSEVEGDETFTIVPAAGGTLPMALVQFAGNTGTITDNDRSFRASWNSPGGTVTLTSPSEPITSGQEVVVPDAQEVVFTVQADHRIQEVTVDGQTALPAYVTATTGSDTHHTYTFTAATPQQTAPHTIEVVFAHQVEMTAAAGGRITHTTSGQSVSGDGPVAVIADHGQNAVFSFSADSGRCVTGVHVDGTSIGGFSGDTNYDQNEYTFSNVTANHTLAADFGTAIMTVLLGADDGADGTDADLHVQQFGGWRAYVTGPDHNTNGIEPFKTGTHGESFSVPGDTGSFGGCNARYIVVEFLTMDGWQTPNRVRLDLNDDFRNQQVIGLYDKDSYVLTIVSPNGTVFREPEGEPAIGQQRYLYGQGTEVELSAAPEPGWYFSLWNGDIGGATPTNSVIRVTMDQDRTVQAVFVQPCQDADGDGFTTASDGSCVASEEIDCDDTNPNIHPGALEICGDGIDQDCDGKDSLCGPMDQDNDGDGYTPRQGDCNDNDPKVHPGAYDDPNTKADEDCFDGPKEKGSEVTCVTASDVPANAAVKPAPPLIMYLVDDSGSMDWEFMTDESDGRFSSAGYVFYYDELQKTYAHNSSYRVLTDAQRRMWRSQYHGYNKIYFNPNATYTPWPKWKTVSGVAVRSGEKEYNPLASGATFPHTAYAAGYTHADMDYPRLNSYDAHSTRSSMYHPGGTRTAHDFELNAEYFSVIGGQQVMVTRDSSSTSSTTTYADAIGLSTNPNLSANRGYPAASVPLRPEIIFDNSDTTYSELGAWYNTTGNQIYTWDGSGRYADARDRSAYWNISLEPAQAGSYYVYAWINENTNRDRKALYTIYSYNAGNQLIKNEYRVDQRRDNGSGNTPRYGARWIRINSTPLRFIAESAPPIRVPNAHYYTQDTDGNTYLVTIPGEGRQVGDYSLRYYQFIDRNNDNVVNDGELVEKVGSAIPDSIIPKRKDALGNSVTDPAELAYMVRQDFADWFSFYRKRILTTKAAIGLSVEGMKGVELGLHTINRSSSAPLALIENADGAAKNTYLSIIYNLRAEGSTPLRRGLWEVGKYFQKGDSGDYSGLRTTSGLGTRKGPHCTSPDDSVFWDAHPDVDNDTCDDSGGECQRAYVIAMTDGFYNESFSSVGNIDANSAYNTYSVFRDGVGNTLADVAMYFYATDLDPSLGDNVPAKGFDNNPKQHLVTYAVAFGVSGQYDPNRFPDCLPSCKSPGVDGCPRIDDLRTVDWAEYSSTSGIFTKACPAWWNDNPNGAQSPRRIDDLYHAAVNSRGSFLNASDPQELVAAMQTIKDLIEDQTGTASSVSINANKVEEDTLLFQTTYDSSDWSGDTLAKCLDSSGLVSSCSFVSCEQGCSTAYATCIASCPEGDGDCQTACRTARQSCTAACTGQTCAQIHVTCLAGCTDASCQAACNNANRTCQLNPPEVKWSAAKKLSSVEAANRKIITSTEAGLGVAFQWDELTPLMKTQLQGDVHILNYLRGDSTYERRNDAAHFRNFRNRSGKLGDFINAEPYHYANKNLGIDWVIVGANDGMLHVFDGDTGEEVFAYIPQEVFRNLYLLSQETYNENHKFFVDGYVTVQDLGNRVILVGGLGKGGKGYFALDLTAAATHKSDIEANAGNIVLWEYTPASFPSITNIRDNLGYSFSRPQIVKSNATDADWVLVFGNGYESVNMRAVLFGVGLNTSGSIQWTRTIDTGVGDSTNGTNCNGLSSPALIHPQGDRKNDFAYAGDLLGNLWKFDLNATDKDGWNIYFEDTSKVKQPLFQARSEAGYRQPITMQPVITSACPLDTKGYMILFGTGRILDPSADFLDQSVQTVYGIWDWSAAWSDNPHQKYLGAFQGQNTTITTGCESNCSTLLGDPASFGSCIYRCAGDSDCVTDCQKQYSSCVTNCGAVRNLSHVSDIIGSDAAGYVTLLRQTQIWAGGINYNSDGSVRETVYGATNLDVYDQIARVMSDNRIDWYLPKDRDAFAGSTNKTTKHVGWFFDLPANGERIVRDMTVANGKLIFTSTIPSDSPCKSGGTSYHWAVDACTGSRLDSAFFDINRDERINSHDYINIGTEAMPIWVAVSAIGVHGISPAVTVVDVMKNAYERLYYPDQDELEAMLGNVHGTPIIYWRDLEWKD